MNCGSSVRRDVRFAWSVGREVGKAACIVVLFVAPLKLTVRSNTRWLTEDKG